MVLCIWLNGSRVNTALSVVMSLRSALKTKLKIRVKTIQRCDLTAAGKSQSSVCSCGRSSFYTSNESWAKTCGSFWANRSRCAQCYMRWRRESSSVGLSRTRLIRREHGVRHYRRRRIVGTVDALLPQFCHAACGFIAYLLDVCMKQTKNKW